MTDYENLTQFLMAWHVFMQITKPESVIFGMIKICFMRNKMVQDNLNWSGPAEFSFFLSLVCMMLQLCFTIMFLNFQILETLL